MDKRTVNFPAEDIPLRDDVNTLGAIVGEVLVEQYGRNIFQHVESLRIASIARRESADPDLSGLADTVAAIDLRELHHVIRGFSGYFQLVNLAERVHRIRRIRDYQRDGTALAGSLHQVLSELREAGIDDASLQAQIAGLVIEPVMTAHPTEATRRTLLEKERAIVQRLVQRFDAGRTPAEEKLALDRVRQQITTSWQTRSYSEARTTVATERDHVLFYISEILYEIVPVFYESLHAALAASYPEVLARAPLPRIVSFGSWVGGDMDGNPNVDHRTLAASLAEHRRLILTRYTAEVHKLAGALSQSLSEVPVSDAVLNRVADYSTQLPEIAAAIVDRYADMPYRSLLGFIRFRLEQVTAKGTHAYAGYDEFLADIRLIQDSLSDHRGTHAGLFQVERLIWRIRTFGFHLAGLDIRQDATELRAAVGELLGVKDWADHTIEQRTRLLAEALADPPALPQQPGPQLERALAVFRTINESRHSYGSAAIGAFIISMTRGADDVLSVLLLARSSGLADASGNIPLDVAPLLETGPDLEQGANILQQLADVAPYRTHLAQRDNRQLIMIGYSDSCKDGGIASARWALYQAQQAMSNLATELGLGLGFFHGRGGTVSRGGGNMVHGIYAAPANSVNGYLRVTEQGEVIHQKYGIRPIALRNLELITGATLAASLKKPTAMDSNWPEIITTLATASRKRYRKLVYETPAFEQYFRQATPIDVIERLAIGSRPSARRDSGGIEHLRAIPWVFAWAQVRLGLPGAFGAGTGLATAIEKHGLEAVRAMLAWPFFSGLLNDIEMVLAKSDFDIGQRYSLLADTSVRSVHEEIARELQQARSLILTIKQNDQPLDEDPTLQRAIRLRNPYVDPLNLLQIKLLEDWRATSRQDDVMLAALFDTVNGIARGIQNTG